MIKDIRNEAISMITKETLSYYELICKEIDANFKIKNTIWDKAGRRGSFFHGYVLNGADIDIGFYFPHDYKGRFQFKVGLDSSCLMQIDKLSGSFSEATQSFVKESIFCLERFKVSYLTIDVTEQTYVDILKIINLIKDFNNPISGGNR